MRNVERSAIGSDEDDRLVRAVGSPGPARLLSLLVAANLAAWCWAWAATRGAPTLLGVALLAWVLGLRHAVDADHIAAIDNVVRRLMQAGPDQEGGPHGGGRPHAIGLWFSLGHSTVVVLASLAVSIAAAATQGRLDRARDLGGTIGTLVSAGFLASIATSNAFVLHGLWRRVRLARRGVSVDPMALESLLEARGFMARMCRRLFRGVTRSWHMYPVGLLFGLGFDTATAIGVLAISAAQASHGMSAWHLMVFPALFTAGMALVDTADSVLMVDAYGWAFINPLRKLWYNMTITAASVLVALLIGGVEVLGLLSDRLRLAGPFWSAIARLNASAGTLGVAVVGIFGLCWTGSMLAYRLAMKRSRQGEA